MRLLKPNTLYCFSPPVMIATFFIEVIGAAWTIWRYKLDEVTRLVAMILGLLATFQLAEYSICEGAFGLNATSWARIGFVAITLLPPLGIHLTFRLARNSQKIAKVATTLGYMTAACFIVYFLLEPGFAEGRCMGNYVIFAITHQVSLMYGAYYYGLLIAAVAMSFHFANKVKNIHSKKALHGLAMGYLLFMVPTTAANLIAPETLAAIPSVMCGFAVILAVMLLGVVLPNFYAKQAKVIVPKHSRA